MTEQGARDRALELLRDALDLLDQAGEHIAAIHVSHAVELLDAPSPSNPVEAE